MSVDVHHVLEALQPRLVRFFAARLTDAHLRDDLVGRVNERVLRRAAEGAPIEDVERFAFGVAKHVLQEHWREASRNRSSEVTLTETVENIARTLTSTTAVTGAFSRSAALEALKHCLVELPDVDQTIAVRCYGDGKSKDNRAALSEELAMTRNALDVRISRIRARLEECVKNRLTSRLAK
ncbi:MAG: sigma-70 family RNA polymerase sigma factor [Gemmatimonadaceae bacterium]